MTPRRALSLGVAGTLVLALGLPPQISSAQSPSERREEARRERAAAAAELDVLQADNAELEAAVAALEDHVATQSAQVDTARQAAEAAEDEVRAAEVKVEEMQADIAVLREVAEAQAVEAYMSPSGAGLDEIIESSDFNEASQKQALLDNVAERNADVLDQLRAAEDELEQAERDAATASEEAAAHRAEAEDRLADLETARAEQARVQAALEDRIDIYRSEVDALAAEEQELTAVIQYQAAAAEGRRAEERRAAAARQASMARSSSEAGSASSGGSGGGGSSGSSSGGSDGGGSSSASSAPARSGARSSSGIIWPVDGQVTSEYGPRWGRLHAGIDIAAPTGTPIWAAKAGTVIYRGQQGGYGNIIVVDHGGGFTTVYPHQSRMAASVGQSVSQGEVIGYVGCSGSCTGPHLHFETRVNGQAENPRRHLP